MTGYDQDFFWYWFVNIPGIGNRSRRELIARYGHPSLLYDCPGKELEDLLTEGQLQTWEASRDYKKTEEGLRRLTEEEIRFVHWESADYPQRFRHLYDPPYGFYLKGDLPDPDKPALAIVGSRKPTAYGRKMAERYTAELADHGVVIISGMAAGIDSCAHRAALDCQGSTLGILGGGIDSMYPRVNWNLYLDMYQHAGILSEYNIGVVNHAGLFPMRNRLISGISDAVLVVEAGIKSGSLITADQGIEQGKDIYAIPGRLTDLMSKGCNHLIAQGAAMTEDPADLLTDLWEISHKRQGKPQEDSSMAADQASSSRNPVTERDRRTGTFSENPLLKPEEARILQAMDEINPSSFEELLEKTGYEWGLLQHHLVNMELRGWISQVQQNLYLRHIF